MKKIICDRCEKDINWNDVSPYNRMLTFLQEFDINYQMDMCFDCGKLLHEKIKEAVNGWLYPVKTMKICKVCSHQIMTKGYCDYCSVAVDDNGEHLK